MQYKIFPLFFLTVSCVVGADWQATGQIGFGAYHYLTYQTPAGSAQGGIGARYVLNAVIGHNLSEHFALEAGWTFQDGDLEIASGGQKTAFDANSHAVRGEVLYYFRDRVGRFRPFLAGGGGVKMYHAIETVRPRPLAQFGSFADGIDARALITYGGGIEWSLSPHWALRLDARDYTTPFPAAVIVPAPGSNLSGWLHDGVVTIGVEFRKWER